MKSLKAKLILVVVSICLAGVGFVIGASVFIVRDGQNNQTQISNNQVADLISRSIISRVDEYRRQFRYVFSAWRENPSVTLASGLFPDFLWMKVVPLGEAAPFEWTNSVLLAEKGLDVGMLLGSKNQSDLVDEAKFKFRKENAWMLFNSTVHPLQPSILLVTGLHAEGGGDLTHIGLAELAAEPIFEGVKVRDGQEVTLMDSRKNILLSTRKGWDSSEVAFNDQTVLKVIEDLKEGGKHFSTIEYGEKEDQVTSIFKFSEGGGLSVIIQESLSSAKAVETRILILSLLAALIVLIFTANATFFFAGSISKPLSELMRLMERAGKGEFTGKIIVKSRDEIGRLATIFNTMMADLKKRDQEIENAKARLIQSEKMGAFGQMSAGIAHEVKNPLAGILGYAQMSKKKLTPDSPVMGYLDIIEKETVRCKEIVENLMRFTRQEKATMARIDVNRTIKDSIRLVEHQLGISGIKLVQMFALDGAPIWIMGNSNQLQQVMMNLLLNAQQAMESKGTVTVSTHFSPETQRVLVMISDTGAGMSEEVKSRIFEPFFTTKGVGKGTGLGLSVSIGIIKDHNGTIDVDSTVGKGTTFTIGLPCQSDQSEPAKEAAA